MRRRCPVPPEAVASLAFPGGIPCALVALVAGCGRLGFDALPAGDGTIASEHDEDGDGVPDAIDVCPHLPGTQVDSDHDGVGDDCDPEPATARQSIALFATMQPGDQPFETYGAVDQRADSLHFDGSGSGGLFYIALYRDVRVAVGFDIIATTGGATTQHQTALAASPDDQIAHDFVELNEIMPSFSNAQVTNFSNGSYTTVISQALPTGIHPGAVMLQATEVVGAGITLDGGYPGEPYHLVDTTAPYGGSDHINFGVNNVEVEIRYVIVIVTT